MPHAPIAASAGAAPTGAAAPARPGPLRLQDVCLTLAGRPLVRLDREIASGEVLTVMGASGSGKSSLLLALAGFVRPPFALAGRILLGARDLTGAPPQERRMGLMFQAPLLFPHMSVGENLLFGLTGGGSRADRRRQVEAALADAGLEGFADRSPDTLSGGQQSRVALLRVLLSQPQALLLDEPFSALDAGTRDGIRRLVFTAAQSAGLPVVLVTHDPQDAAAAGGPVITLEG
ncbi:ATP-binding cassette domain-containing protein [Pannonibacter tanglangensis]|uniref:ATP-binding cassette domain-containing protein n=1 Tax=Pannonibacter tanglangensis TaxID=2750084 RepID=A0ABW9ZM92_9HYPH|nr:ATP-binding cassette domain-containing protein [Pannonibacter sp. XCT-34]NBN64701.1 ATP-binding cassette domain-containing protein [Pannonibacter sp. XCT-34]